MDKPKKWTQNGLCIKCQGIGHVITQGVTSMPCSQCDGMGMKYRKPRGPRKVLIPDDAAEYVANYLNKNCLNTTGKTIVEALQFYNLNRGA